MLVLLQAENEVIMEIFHVKNYDDKFLTAFAEAEREWNEHTDSEYKATICQTLKEKGYDVTILNNDSVTVYTSPYL